MKGARCPGAFRVWGQRATIALLHGRRTFEGAAIRFERWLESAPDVAVDWFGRYAARKACPDCLGTRLRPEARAFRVGGRRLPELLELPVERFLPALADLPLEGRDAVVGAPILREFAFLGRHALLIYMVHQPVVMGILFAVDWLAARGS